MFFFVKPRTASAFTSGNDQRDVGVHAPGRGIVDHDRALLSDLRRPDLRDIAARRHQADIRVGEVVILQRLHLEDAIAEGDLLADGAAGRDRHDLVRRKGALVEDVEHLATDIARRADYGDLVAHLRLLNVRPAVLGGAIESRFCGTAWRRVSASAVSAALSPVSATS
jgi:hypothetical protein